MNCNRTQLVIRQLARALVVCGVLANVWSANVARAESAEQPQNVELYNSIVRQAVENYERGKYDQAKALFAQAHHVFPNARTLRGLGMVAYALRDYVEAIQYLEAAITSRVKPLDSALENDSRSLLLRARAFTGVVRVRTSPVSASITVNGAPARRLIDHAVTLNPGQYEIQASAPEYQPATHLVRIEPGSLVDVEFNLAKVPSPSVPALQPLAAAEAPGPEPEAQPQLPDAEDHLGKTAGPWIVVGASAAVAIAGGVMLGVALHDVSVVEDSGPTTNWSKVQGKYDSSSVVSGVGIAMLAVGGAGIAAGLTWHFLEPAESEQVALDVGPLGVRLRGSW